MLRLLQLSVFVLLSTISVLVYAQNEDFLINKVHLQLNAEKWVTTQTALVTVSVNATVQTQGIDKVTASVKEHLKKISETSDWNIMSLDRQEEKSGLESIQIRAEARLQQNELSELRNKAKLISTPGEVFKIESIQFTPSDEDMRKAEAELRNNIYTQAKAEIDRLNKVYPDQKYYLHSVDFNAGPRPMPMAAMYMKQDAASNTRMSSQADSSPLSIGNKREIMANVVIGSLADMTRKGLPPNL